MTMPVAAIILAAGKGTRMRSDLPKVLHRVAGLPMLAHVLRSAQALNCERVVTVTAPDMQAVQEAASRYAPNSVSAIQHTQEGTAHAVLAAREALKGFTGLVLVLYGDTPMLSVETLRSMLSLFEQDPTLVAAVLGAEIKTPSEFGRLVLNKAGKLERIVEFKDASDAERALTLCNSGVMAVQSGHLWPLLEKIDNNNAKGEYYLTDLISHARAKNLTCAVVRSSATEAFGVNSKRELALAEAYLQQRLLQAAMEQGVTLIGEETIFLSADTVYGRDVLIHPQVVIGTGVTLGDGVEVKSFSHLESAKVAKGAIIGPYARLRPGADIGAEAHIGNFVEIKNSRVGDGAKVNHHSYIGDASIGAGSNIGAGTITCNYDGFRKFKTTIGNGVFVGSNSALVAPVTIGDGAYVAAGSVITEDVAADSLGLARERQSEKQGWAAEFRATQKPAKKSSS